MDEINQFTPAEEIAHAITHGLGAVLAVAALVLLVVFASIYGNVWHIVSFSVFGVTLVTLYTISSVYHGLTHPRAKSVMRTLDHAAIYLLIAGTYTPFTLVTLRGPLGWALFGAVWGLAVLGIAAKMRWPGTVKAPALISYILMGWLCVFAAKPLMAGLSGAGLMWLVAGGLLYTLGTVFFACRKIPYHHVFWHLFVIAGSVAHFTAIFFYVLPRG